LTKRAILTGPKIWLATRMSMLPKAERDAA
jgi:hypothetical protein